MFAYMNGVSSSVSMFAFLCGNTASVVFSKQHIGYWSVGILVGILSTKEFGGNSLNSLTDKVPAGTKNSRPVGFLR
jgi:hypothetical protein